MESSTSVSRRYMDGTLLESFLLDDDILYGRGVVPGKIAWWAGVNKTEPPRRTPDGVIGWSDDLTKSQELLFMELAQAAKTTELGGVPGTQTCGPYSLGTKM